MKEKPIEKNVVVDVVVVVFNLRKITGTLKLLFYM